MSRYLVFALSSILIVSVACGQTVFTNGIAVDGAFVWGNGLITLESTSNTQGDVETRDLAPSVGQLYGVEPDTGNALTNGELLTLRPKKLDQTQASNRTFVISSEQLTGDGSIIVIPSGSNLVVGLSTTTVEMAGDVYVAGDIDADTITLDGITRSAWSAAGDDLGNHISTGNLDMAGNSIENADDISANAVHLQSSLTMWASTNYEHGVAIEKGQHGLNVMAFENGSWNAGEPIIETLNSEWIDIGGSITAHGFLDEKIRLHDGVYLNDGGLNAGGNVITNAVYYGDGSNLSGVDASDNLGSHIATGALDMAGHSIVGVDDIGTMSNQVASLWVNNIVSYGTHNSWGWYQSGWQDGLVWDYQSGNTLRLLALTDGTCRPEPLMGFYSSQRISIGGYPGWAGLPYKVHLANGVYLASGDFNVGGNVITNAVYYGDGSNLTGIDGVDNLGDHTATAALNLAGNYLSGDGDSEGIYVDPNGDVGIGTGEPAATLDINGSSGNIAGYPVVGLLTSPNSGSWSLVFRNHNAGLTNATGFYVDHDGDLVLGSEDQDSIMRWDPHTGRVGVGTALPETLMHVAGDARVDGNVTITGTYMTNGVPLKTGDDLGDHTAAENLALAGNYLAGDGDSEGIYIDSNGDVGIGTDSPATTLDVNGAGRFTQGITFIAPMGNLSMGAFTNHPSM